MFGFLPEESKQKGDSEGPSAFQVIPFTNTTYMLHVTLLMFMSGSGEVSHSSHSHK